MANQKMPTPGRGTKDQIAQKKKVDEAFKEQKKQDDAERPGQKGGGRIPS
jgi:hypothetical protein